jgi:hypothetical protein
MPTRLTDAAGANEYLKLFAESGTHYVSSIFCGDRILQILAYNAAQWAQLKADFARFPDQLRGPPAYQNLLYYTRPLTADGYGNVAQRGIVTIASRDSVFQQSIADGKWVDAE